MTKSKIFFFIRSFKNTSTVLFIFLDSLITMFIASTLNSMFAYIFWNPDIPHKSAICTLAFPPKWYHCPQMGQGMVIWIDPVRLHLWYLRPLIHLLKHTCLPSAEVISLYFSIGHFACNGLTMDSLISIDLSSWPPVNLFHQFFNKSIGTSFVGTPWNEILSSPK